MTQSEYQELKNLSNNCIRKYSKPQLIAEDVIHDAYVLLIEKKIDYNFQTIKRIIVKIICSYEIGNTLSLEVSGRRIIKFFQDYKVCPGCPKNGPQPLAAFPIRKIYPNGRVMVRAHCIKCEGKKSTIYYQKLKKENPTKYNEVLKKAKEKMRTNYGVIKKNPAAYKIFRRRANENNRAYKKRKKDEKLKTGWHPRDGNRSPLIARREPNGKIVNRFPSVKEAAKTIGRSRSALSKAIRKQMPCAGYYFGYVKPVTRCKKPKTKKEKYKGHNAKAVIARDRKGKMVAKFASITEAAKSIKRSRPNVVRSIRKKLACGGYYFEGAPVMKNEQGNE